MTIFVPGIPVPKGSTRAFVRGGRAITTGANPKTRIWEHEIRAYLSAEHDEEDEIRTFEVVVTLTFRMPRPKAHHRKDGTVKGSWADVSHTSKPDLDKLIRAALDAMTGIEFVDDSQVTSITASKRYCAAGEQPGIEIELL